METSGDAAEKIVRMSLDGVEVVAKITGETAEHVANILIRAMRDHKQTRGKASLNTIIRSGKSITVFPLDDRDLKKFCQEAKKYGVLYHVLKDRDKTDGKCDIMVREEDRGKVNRILERFNLGKDHNENIKSSIEHTMYKEGNRERPAEGVKVTEEKTEDVRAEKEEPGKNNVKKKNVDEFLESLFGDKKDDAKEEKTEEKTENKSYTENPHKAETDIPGQSEPSSKEYSRGATETGSQDYDKVSSRPSVRQELRKLASEQKKDAKTERPQKTKSKVPHEKVINKNKGARGHVR